MRIDIAISLAEFYIKNYRDFKLHTKEDAVFDSVDEMAWGCGRVMPQSLNDSIFFIRIFTALDIIKPELPESLSTYIKNEFAPAFFKTMRPQVFKIHNIHCWINCGIGVIGLFTGSKEMVDFAFNGEFSVNSQLQQGVTSDFFWYEGSIHYNFFTMEGALYLAMFAQKYNQRFESLPILKNMLYAAYRYAFSNLTLPNPNDGWPNISLKTYSYIYDLGAGVFKDEAVSDILRQIIIAPFERKEVPLSKPYYFHNDVSLERLWILRDFDFSAELKRNNQSQDFEKSNYALLKNERINLFFKYGHNGPSHAHPDKMTIEVVADDCIILKDLSNSGYGSVVCNEWHRTTAAHNTVAIDGQNQTGMEPGRKLYFDDNRCRAEADKVYEDVCFDRELALFGDGFTDCFTAKSGKERTYDYFLHMECQPEAEPEFEAGEHGLNFNGSGYQYFKNVKKLRMPTENEYLELRWHVGGGICVTIIHVKDKEVFLCDSPGNPVTQGRKSLVVRGCGKEATFKTQWKLIK